MATSYTENYHLPQWAAEDQVLREEFNEAWADVDEGLTSTRQEAEQKGCVAGTYTGNGKTMADGGLLVELGFHPKFVIVSLGWTNTTYPSPYLALVGEKAVSGMGDYLSLQDTGFMVGVGPSSFVKLNEAGVTYSYVAFR